MEEKLASYCILLVYKAFGNEVQEENILRNRLYFLSVLLDIDLGFEDHFYGPYSSSLKDVCSALWDLGWTSKTSFKLGTGTRHESILTDVGIRRANQAAEKMPALWDQIQEVASKIKAAGDLDRIELAVAAKIHFTFKDLNGKVTVNQIQNPSSWAMLTEEQLTKALMFLGRIGLTT